MDTTEDTTEETTEETTAGAAAARLHLYPEQVRHAARLKDILTRSPFALDLSALGTGKTYTGSALALDPSFGFRHVVVVAPVSVLPKWVHMGDTYGVPVDRAISFAGMRSVKDHQPKHGLLVRRDHVVELGDRFVDRVEFRASDTWRRFVEEGVLLVVDEIQHVKNHSTQSAACQALVKTIVEAAAPNAKVLLLSGSPMDKEEQAVTLFKTLCVMKGAELSAYDVHRGVLVWKGMNDIVSFCSRLDAAETRRATTMHHDNLKAAVYTLFRRVVKPHVSHSMVPERCVHAISKFNGFYDIVHEAHRQDLEHGVRALRSAVRYNANTGTLVFTADALSAVTTSMMQIEQAKMSTFVRVAVARLESSPFAKVVLCVNYKSSVSTLAKELAVYAPLVLDGSVPAARRGEVLGKFQSPTTDHRLLISNLQVCSTGIDLDDKHGGFPRFCLASPNYAAITLHQLGHRFLRMDTRSDSTLHMLYGKTIECELGVLSAIARKARVMKDITTEQVDAGIVFPSDYERYTEPAADQRDLLVAKQHRVARIIQKRWLECYHDPSHPVCKRRLEREFREMNETE